MAQRPQKPARSTTTLPPPRAAVTLPAAGIDIGAAAHGVAVPPSDAPQPGRRCGACTADLEALADWLATWRRTTIALASTGGSWIPLCARLATRGFAVLGVAPPQGPQSTGRPTSARHDCPWRQRLHPCGLRAGAGRPADQIWGLRRALRHRALLRTHAGQPLQPRQHALPPMHSTLQPGGSALPGVTGLALLRALLAGAHAPETLAHRRDERYKHEEATIARAFPGHGRDEPLGALAHAVALSDGSHQHITTWDQPSAAALQTVADRSAGAPVPPPSRPRTRGGTHPACAVRAPLHRSSGVALTPREGLDATTAWGLRSARGLAMTRWPTGHHFPSWWGRCPHHRVSGGTVCSRRTTPGANRAATALRLAAACWPHRQRAFGALCRRMPARLGAPTAMTAPAHTRARLLSTRRTHGTASVRQGMDA